LHIVRHGLFTSINTESRSPIVRHGLFTSISTESRSPIVMRASGRKICVMRTRLRYIVIIRERKHHPLFRWNSEQRTLFVLAVLSKIVLVVHPFHLCYRYPCSSLISSLYRSCPSICCRFSCLSFPSSSTSSFRIVLSLPKTRNHGVPVWLQ
jgi:hypothetical protein